MSVTTKDLYEIVGLNSDGVSGFQAQLSYRRSKLEVIWPEHLTGKRIDDFREGSYLARQWLAMRLGSGKARRSIRYADFRDLGITRTLLPNGEERREEQIYCLKEVAKLKRQVAAASGS